MRKRNSVFLSEVIVLVHILQSLWNKHVFGLVIIYFTPGFFQWLRVFFSLWDWDKIIWSLPTTVYFEESTVFRRLFYEKVEDSVFLVFSEVSLKSYYQRSGGFDYVQGNTALFPLGICQSWLLLTPKIQPRN